MSNCTNGLRRGEALKINDIANLTSNPDLAQLMSNLGIQSFIAVPILDDNGLFAFIGMSWDHIREIDSDIQGLLHLVGSIFLNALQRKRNEEKIHKLNEELEQRVADRTSELLRANEQLQSEIRDKQEIDNALRETENQLRSILDALPIPVVVVNDQRMLLYVNPVTVSMFGTDIRENKDITSIFSVDPDDRLKIQERLTIQRYIKSLEVHYVPPLDTAMRTA